MNVSMRAVLLAAALIGMVDDAIACSCAPTNLERKFQGSTNVFTAVVISAHIEGERDVKAEFETTEIFKGGVPFRILETHLGGASCGTTFNVGGEYLFFLGSSGSVGMCSGHSSVDRTGARPNHEYDLLKQYLAGETADLSSRWSTRNRDGLCETTSDFRLTENQYVSYISLYYRKSVSDLDWWSKEPERNVVGFNEVKVRLPTSEEEPGSAISLESQDVTYKALWRKDEIRGWSGDFQIRGAEAMRLITEFVQGDSVEVTGTINRVGDVSGEIRTTNGAIGIADFAACVEATN